MIARSPRRFEVVARRDGVALVLILAFLVLLTVVTVAFFSRAITERQVSNSSAAQTRADLLARSACDVIVGDLKQEIVLGSNSPAATPSPTPIGSPPAVIYAPTPNPAGVPTAYMVPQQSGLPTPSAGATPPMPNLIRRSVRSDPMPTPGIASRASAVNSTQDLSANGRAVSLARWNSHYLLPRHNPTDSYIDSTPISPLNTTSPEAYGFTPPDWVMVTSAGPKVLSAPDSTTVGRYAYAIYDEGGLLDINAAGFPNPTPAPAGTPFPALKGSLAYADLTQLPLPAGNVLQSQIDSLVGWRNYASAVPNGTQISNYSFDANGALRFYNYIQAMTTGFLTVNPSPSPSPAPTTTASGRTDQMFTSRQALLRFRRATGLSQNTLQYLGTFSRDLEQPSYVPNPARPRVENASTTDSSPFGSGNSAYVATPPSASTDINPPFLQVRVATQFTRPDGTSANVGDPLVLRRFPLSRLALITSGATATQNQTTDAIFRNFGLYRMSNTGPWLYNHLGAGAGSAINRLDAVKGLGREPDFFELLKAAINVGSIGKSSSFQGNVDLFKYTGTAGNLQYLRDIQSDLQILQIGANIIDQSKADNFPTQIQFSANSNYTVSGVEDLPYLYRFRNWVMRTGLDSGALLIQPELWNPHSLGSSANVPSGSTPTNFRVRVANDPSSTSSNITLDLYFNNDQGTAIDYSSTVTLNSGITPTPLTFTIGASGVGGGFREPTLLSMINVPSGSALSGDSYSDYPPYTPNPTRVMTGLTIATFPWYSGSTPTDVVTLLREFGPTSVYNTCFHFYLDYQGPSGAWVTYDDEASQYEGGDTDVQSVKNASTVALQTATTSTNSWDGAGRADPRTRRWGFHETQYINDFPQVSATYNTFSTYRPTNGLSYGDHIGGYLDAGFYGAKNNYPSGYDQYRGIQYGYWTENSTRLTSQTDSPDGAFRFDVDPDGVPRRAMGGYNSDPNNGGSLALSTASATTGQPVYGLPMVTANYSSRPTILHRPFLSVAELGYVFRDTPWDNLNLSFPESGDLALLDVFCINENYDPNGMIAGRVDLNTRQAPVLQALLSGTLLDKDDATIPTLNSVMASAIAAKLVNRTSNLTSSTQGPLSNRADLVGRATFNADATGAAAKSALSSALTTSTMDPNTFYTGFSADIGTQYINPASSTLVANPVYGTAVALIPRQREAAMRALSDVGNTRVWNLLIDLVAQSGRYPSNSSKLSSFLVEGEKRYWLHVAIDRYTGKVIDKQLELVTE